jgi:hypothetical protein
MRFKDLVGQKFNRLEVKEYAGKMKRGQSRWLCLCDCGTIKIVQGFKLTHNETKSCGCLLRENKSGFVHGGYHSPEYTSYHAAKKRCTNLNAKQYADYGGRGIEFRFQSFEEFFAEIGPRPEPKFAYSLERINNDGHYEKGNVRWATKTQQARNRRCDKCGILLARIRDLEARIASLEAEKE